MITGKTRLAGIIATPIKHSFSPLIHNTAFQELGIDAVYLAFDTLPKNFEQAIGSISALNLLGVNLSMPYKKGALKYMDSLGTEVKLIQAMNTIVCRNSRLIGRNTDGIGYIESLRSKGISIREEKVTILGAGGAGLAVIAQMALEGMRKISVFNRKSVNFCPLHKRLKELSYQTKVKIELFDLADEKALKKELSTSRILANMTNVGMGEMSWASPIRNPQVIPENILVTDAIYVPRETKLLQQAKSRGAQTMNGLGMLLHQAAVSFNLWTGRKMPIEIIEKKMEEEV
ncbi:MAG: shikimate dehydrogenase [Lactobacillales bacterium]|jgi:shikimate dehydrogenase|nr:shikimate dehydrogenase [Lactobacillales bacterium]